MIPNNFFNHSGGAKGADTMWDIMGRKYGFQNHKHWRPEDLYQLDAETKEQLLQDVRSAADALGRPYVSKGIELIRRNWLQVKHAEANIFAIAPIIKDGMMNTRGFKNKTGKSIVDGGTGWAVEMAIQKTGLVFVFDTLRDEWYSWSYSMGSFVPMNHIPRLTPLYAGIGSRVITKKGVAAIRDVYAATLQYLQKSDHGKDTDNR